MVNHEDWFLWVKWFHPLGANAMASPEFWAVLIAVLGAVWLIVKD